MRKFFAALALVLALAAVSYAADEKIDGVWGLKFGDEPAAAHRHLIQTRKATLLVQYEYQPNYSEAFYKVNFFGRSGNLLLRFSRKGLFLARFSFVRQEKLPSELPAPKPDVIDARSIAMEEAAKANINMPKPIEQSKNFVQLRDTLTAKYGPARTEFKVNKAPAGCKWESASSGKQTIVLFENRSLSRNDTVLTYEDASRR